MKITDIARIAEVSDVRAVRQSKVRDTSARTDTPDVGSLSPLGAAAEQAAAASQTSIRPMSELNAMLQRAKTADPAEIADALLTRGFLQGD